MVDLILLSFTVGLFAAGFWCGSKYQSYAAMWKAFKDWL